jgi:hypothetical protein
LSQKKERIFAEGALFFVGESSSRHGRYGGHVDQSWQGEAMVSWNFSLAQLALVLYPSQPPLTSSNSDLVMMFSSWAVGGFYVLCSW